MSFLNIYLHFQNEIGCGSGELKLAGSTLCRLEAEIQRLEEKVQNEMAELTLRQNQVITFLNFSIHARM